MITKRASRNYAEDLGSWLPSGRERGRHRLVKPTLADHFDEQDRTGLRDEMAAVAADTYTRVRPDTLLHLRSAASLMTNRTWDKSQRPRSEALLA